MASENTRKRCIFSSSGHANGNSNIYVFRYQIFDKRDLRWATCEASTAQ